MPVSVQPESGRRQSCCPSDTSNTMTRSSAKKPPAPRGRKPAGSGPRGSKPAGPKSAGSKPAATKPENPIPEDAKPERIAKVMARAGLCSRRDAEKWIEAGRVKVNGKLIVSPALNVDPGDKVEVDGNPLPDREQARLWRYHKPSGLVVSHRDEKDRPSVFDKMPEEMPRVISIGRLDINTEGLLLLTNDGELARLLELPATGWIRRYRVRAHGEVEQEALDALKSGLNVEGIQYGPIEATLDKQQGGNAWLTISLREGKNREVKRICEHLGLKVNRLIRTSFGPFQLGELPRGEVDEVSSKVINEQIRGGARKGGAKKKPGKPARKRPPMAGVKRADRRR
jgi:23S rRNA pseudouridine2605 synthase